MMRWQNLGHKDMYADSFVSALSRGRLCATGITSTGIIATEENELLQVLCDQKW